jgi:hypothetical protein
VKKDYKWLEAIVESFILSVALVLVFFLLLWLYRLNMEIKLAYEWAWGTVGIIIAARLVGPYIEKWVERLAKR